MLTPASRYSNSDIKYRLGQKHNSFDNSLFDNQKFNDREFNSFNKYQFDNSRLTDKFSHNKN